MKRAIILTLILTASLSCPCFAQGYSEESIKLGKESGVYVGDYDLEAVLSRQEALKSGQANNSTPTTENGQEKASSTTTRRIKGGVDEYRVVAGGGKDSTQVTDTKDELHVYSNEYANSYNNANYGAKNSTDEFHTAPYDIDANDGYKSVNFDESHINENYKQNVWHPEHRGNRLEGFDEWHYPDEL